MVKLADLSLRAFGDEMAADMPTPGGGSAAAFAGSVAASLVAMVCRVSLDREEVAATDDELNEALEECERLRRRLLELVDEDTLAFRAVMAALRLPKEGEVERATRSAALADATMGATVPPFETLAACRRVLEIAGWLVGRSNANAASDLGVGVHLARAGAEGALLNVAINLSSLPPGGPGDKLRDDSEREIAAARAAAEGAAASIAEGVGLS